MVNRAEAAQLLKHLDKDNSGKISTQELMEFLSSVNCPFNKAQVEKFIKVHDADGDGQLNTDELLKVLCQ
ncbi:Calcium-binding protein [Schistosoma japonicum]|uniref:Calcium-binding protein n=1 Tax=Schistosoma japonicum TaxID=6182 RepID=Q867X8_SCHJA|nr:8 kDa calcium-binding protein [Schistosoma japonicum]AAP31909.1 8 kDa calcium-binding protein [Schistosoma japonicum]ABS87641.1 calcium-binding protein [Schistosoma japonicum]KAH8865654.1 Calcium-binding protein [Schistosoma japonicum]CAX74785.1 Calcium-binding protein [Schistosoma japonicum]